MYEKTVLITGANSGVGFVAARELAAMDRGARAREQVSQAAKGTAPELLLADMSSQSSIRRLAENIHQRFTKIDVMVTTPEPSSPVASSLKTVSRRPSRPIILARSC